MKGLTKIFKLAFLDVFYYIKTYKWAFIIWAIIFPISDLIRYYLRGRFVGTVNFLGMNVDYFIFTLCVSLLTPWVFNSIRTLYHYFYRRSVSEMPYLFDYPVLYVVVIRSCVPAVINLISALIFVFVMSFFTKINPIVIYFIALFYFFALFYSVFSLSLLFGGLAMKIRGYDFDTFYMLISNSVLWILIPTTYSLLKFIPINMHEYLIFIPWTAIIESFRLTILEGFSYLSFFYLIGSIIVSTFYNFLGYLFFNYMFKKARIYGWLFRE